MKLLIEVESREEFESLIVDLEWKMRNWKLDDDTIDKYQAAARTSVDMERDRCAKICADIAGEVDWSARGIMQMDAEQVGIECAKQIRGEK